MPTESTYIIKSVPIDPTETYSSQDLYNFFSVEVGEFEVSTAPMISEAFYNCIAVIGLCGDTALLGHFQGIDELDSWNYFQFQMALRTLLELNVDTIVLAGGAMSDNPVDIARATADRAFADADIRATLPSARLVTSWNDEKNTSKDIIVFPRPGVVAIHDTHDVYGV